MVRGDLGLVTLGSEPALDVPDTRVVGEQVDSALTQSRDEPANRVEVGNIELSDLELRTRVPEQDLVAYPFPLLRAADSHDHEGTRSRQVLGEELTQTAGGTGDDRRTPGLVGHVGGSEAQGRKHEGSRCKRNLFQ